MQPVLNGISAVVFDAYGTLFDVASAARAVQDQLGEKWLPLADAWRSKQLQYTWLRSLAGNHVDFWHLTGEALDFALASQGIHDTGLHERLMAQYLHLATFPEVPSVLAQLRAAGFQLAILSNGTPSMLLSAVTSAGIATSFDQVLSVEEVGVYKPHPAVYLLAEQRLGVQRGAICFVSANGWDAWSAKAFGHHVAWCNRAGQPPERLPCRPDLELPSLATLPECLRLAEP
ncbi:MAG: haloacid dehalogenase type II [Burkholderiales bacterium]|nr:haloacid dehalogenase type II [Burkholderiales bacterium]